MSGEKNFIKYILAIILLPLERDMLHTGTWKDVVSWPCLEPGAHQSCSVTALLSWTEGGKYSERLVGRGKGRGIAHRLPAQVEQTWLGEKLIQFITDSQSQIKRNKTKS